MFQWHALGREEQAKYYELARRERQLHMQMYPDWSSRTNATRGKKRKRKQEPTDGGTNTHTHKTQKQILSLSFSLSQYFLNAFCQKKTFFFIKKNI